MPVVVAPGEVEWSDVLPPSLAMGLPQRLSYRVEVFNAAGRSAGPSDPALAAAGQAPEPVAGLRAEGERGDIVLRWTPAVDFAGEVLLRREVLDRGSSAKVAAAPASATSIGHRQHKRGPAFASPISGAGKDASGPEIMWLQAAETSGSNDLGGTIDGTAVAGVAYRYTAVRSRRTVTADGAQLELRSVESAPIEFTLRDIFPPAAPTGLAAAEYPEEGGAGFSVDLVWQPNGESDLAGYTVYRQMLGADGSANGAAQKLNAQLLLLPAFHDAGVKAGSHVRYTVVAVDKSGNVSVASAAADVETGPGG